MNFLSCQGDIAEIEYDLETEERIELSSTFWEKKNSRRGKHKTFARKYKKRASIFTWSKKNLDWKKMFL